jgi:hypothetical protein
MQLWVISHKSLPFIVLKASFNFVPAFTFSVFKLEMRAQKLKQTWFTVIWVSFGFLELLIIFVFQYIFISYYTPLSLSFFTRVEKASVVIWFDCDESLTCRDLNSNPGYFVCFIFICHDLEAPWCLPYPVVWPSAWSRDHLRI